MPYLNEVVGTIMRDITNAKIYADIACKDVYEIYKNDEILKTFSVPNVQIKELKVNLKFVITNVGINQELEVAVTESELANSNAENISTLEFTTNVATLPINVEVQETNEQQE